MSRFPQLLSPVTLGVLRLPNRVLMAPMSRCRARSDGTVTPIMGEHFAQRSSAGMLITDATNVAPEAVGYLDTPGLWTDEQVQAWRTVTDAVHAVGGVIAVQLNHCGRVSLTQLQPGGGAPVSASALQADGVMLLTPRRVTEVAAEPRPLDMTEIPGVVAQFAQAARRAAAAGFDAVEIHAGDGYLIDQFLRDGVNDRHDRYGGSAENRARFLLEVTEAVAKVFGADRTGVRLSPTSAANDMRDGNPLDTFGTALRHVAALDLAWTHLANAGDTDFTNRLRDRHGKPFILNGGFTPDAANDVIRSELASAVSFGTRYIANPDLVERFESGAGLASADPATFYTGGPVGYTDYPDHVG